ncbi:MAG: IS200/IS605 family transposase [Bryobacterales bacterium]
MPDTYTNLLVHVVFSTKSRDKNLTADVRRELYSYLTALTRKSGSKALAANGGLDHVHLLVLLPPNVTISDLVRFLKANSSRWIRGKFNRTFAWQSGYGAFSVSRSRFGEVRDYIDGQVEHHKRVSFENEFVSLLKRNEIEFESERLWV